MVVLPRGLWNVDGRPEDLKKRTSGNRNGKLLNQLAPKKVQGQKCVAKDNRESANGARTKREGKQKTYFWCLEDFSSGHRTLGIGQQTQARLLLYSNCFSVDGPLPRRLFVREAGTFWRVLQAQFVAGEQQRVHDGQ